MKGLEKELKAFARMLPKLLSSDKGKYALIYDGKLLGTFTSKEDALKFGIEKVGDEEFLIRHIVQDEEPLYFFHGVARANSHR
jgi:hypothetical protein